MTGWLNIGASAAEELADGYGTSHRTRNRATVAALGEAIEAIVAHRPDAAAAVGQALAGDPDRGMLLLCGWLMDGQSAQTAEDVRDLVSAAAACERSAVPGAKASPTACCRRHWGSHTPPGFPTEAHAECHLRHIGSDRCGTGATFRTVLRLSAVTLAAYWRQTRRRSPINEPSGLEMMLSSCSSD
jgi:hypothetical protein